MRTALARVASGASTYQETRCARRGIRTRPPSSSGIYPTPAECCVPSVLSVDLTALTILLADTDHMGDWSAGWWVAMMLMMIVIWALVIFGAVWLARSLSDGHRAIRDRDPVEVLDHRLARGEITVEEYRERRELLKERQDSKQA